jgi:hypothetical protein
MAIGEKFIPPNWFDNIHKAFIEFFLKTFLPYKLFFDVT